MIETFGDETGDDLGPFAPLQLITSSIVDCLKHETPFPMLSMTYTGIETLGWLCSEEDDTGGKEFKVWVDKYIMPQGILPCTGEELYSARNGFAHMLAPTSRLFRQGKVRGIAYTWGDDKNLLNDLISASKITDQVSVNIKDIVRTFLIGTQATIMDVVNDPTVYPRFEEKLKMMYRPVKKTEMLIDAIAIYNGMKAGDIPPSLGFVIHEGLVPKRRKRQ